MTSPNCDLMVSSERHSFGPLPPVISRRFLGSVVVILALIAVGFVHVIPALGGLGRLGDGGVTLIVKFLLAIGFIIVVGNVGGWAAKRLHQPRVIGEMVAGFILSPSLLGTLAPQVQHMLFPTELIPHLSLVAEMAIIIYVFLLGAGLPLGLLRGSGRSVAALGLGTVAIPFLCGLGFAGALPDLYRPDRVETVPFLLFIGVVVGVTAFPVLVRILAEHDLIRSRIGALGLTTAAIGDAIVWCLLVVVVAIVQSGSAAGVLAVLAVLVAFVAVMWGVFRPALREFLARAQENRTVSRFSTPLLLLSAVAGAFITDWIGVHVIFGAFLVGLTVSRDTPLVQELTRTMERGVRFVLPLFFAVLGLNMHVGFLRFPEDFVVCALMIVVAMASKVGATMLIGRWTRLSWEESMGLGVMMSCRGLTELVVISTGLSLGLIGQNLFVIFVVMTLVTTMATGPLLRRLKLRDTDFPIEDREVAP